MYEYVCTHTHTYTYYTYMYIHIYIHIYKYIYIYNTACMNMYGNMYIYTYVYIYLYTHIHVCHHISPYIIHAHSCSSNVSTFEKNADHYGPKRGDGQPARGHGSRTPTEWHHGHEGANIADIEMLQIIIGQFAFGKCEWRSFSNKSCCKPSLAQPVKHWKATDLPFSETTLRSDK